MNCLTNELKLTDSTLVSALLKADFWNRHSKQQLMIKEAVEQSVGWRGGCYKKKPQVSEVPVIN